MPACLFPCWTSGRAKRKDSAFLGPADGKVIVSKSQVKELTGLHLRYSQLSIKERKKADLISMAGYINTRGCRRYELQRVLDKVGVSCASSPHFALWDNCQRAMDEGIPVVHDSDTEDEYDEYPSYGMNDSSNNGMTRGGDDMSGSSNNGNNYGPSSSGMTRGSNSSGMTRGSNSSGMSSGSNGNNYGSSNNGMTRAGSGMSGSSNSGSSNNGTYGNNYGSNNNGMARGGSGMSVSNSSNSSYGSNSSGMTRGNNGNNGSNNTGMLNSRLGDTVNGLLNGNGAATGLDGANLAALLTTIAAGINNAPNAPNVANAPRRTLPSSSMPQQNVGFVRASEANICASANQNDARINEARRTLQNIQAYIDFMRRRCAICTLKNMREHLTNETELNHSLNDCLRGTHHCYKCYSGNCASYQCPAQDECKNVKVVCYVCFMYKDNRLDTNFHANGGIRCPMDNPARDRIMCVCFWLWEQAKTNGNLYEWLAKFAGGEGALQTYESYLAFLVLKLLLSTVVK